MTNTLGKLLDPHEQRDAIHVAIAPVVAAVSLKAGQHVALNEDGCAVPKGVAVGIIDPFLRQTVKPGDRVWLFLYPGTITSLRHDWTHPAFAPRPASGSETWIREFAEGLDLGYEEILEAARGYLKHGDYLCKGKELEGEYVPDEFWTHFEAVTGESAGDDRGNFFTCSC